MTKRKQVVRVFIVALALAGVILAAGYSLRKDGTRGSVKRLTFERTPARLERGRYLVEGPAHCFQCHSEVDWEKPRVLCSRHPARHRSHLLFCSRRHAGAAV